MGRRWWFIVGCYVLLVSAANTYHIATALIHCPYGVEPILVGDINFILSHTEGRESDKDLALNLAVGGLEEMATHFQQI